MTTALKNMAPRLKVGTAVPGPTVGAGYAKGLLDFAVSKQASRERLMERAQISNEDLADLDNRIPFEKYKARMNPSIELTNDPALALHFGEEVAFSELSVVGLIADACETLLHAFVEINRYNGLVIQVDVLASGPRFQLAREDGQTWLVDTRADPNAFPELTESGWARMACGARRFIPAGKVHVKEVHVTHAAPGHRGEYDRIFKVPTVFENSRNALLIDESLMLNRVARTTNYAFGVLSEHAKALLESLEHSKTTRGRVESLLIPILHAGDPGVEKIVGKMGLSRPTLYRKLKAEGVTYEKLLDELRHKMALHYLNGKKVSVNETAYLVGFSDPSAFSRAFRRWTGTSPRKRST